MSTLKVSSVQHASAASPAITLDANGQATLNGLAFPTNGSLSGRNRIINGDMRIDQRNAGAAVTLDNNFIYTLDRWQAEDATDGVFTCQKSTVAPAGFTNSLLLTITTADTSLAASQYSYVRQCIEGFNIADLGWGTASAQAVTLSFWVRSSISGTFGGSIKNNASNRSYAFTYTIASTNTWEYKTVTIPGDTSGTWLTDNGLGLQLLISIGAGSTLSGTAGAWTGANYVSATGATPLIATNGATFYITGVQLEAGTVATPFERRSYGQELSLCERYFEKCYDMDVVPGANISSNGFGCVYSSGSADNSGNQVFFLRYSTRKRARPTLNTYTTAGVSGSWAYGRSGVTGSAPTALTQDGQTGCGIYATVGLAWTTCYVIGAWTASAEL